MPTLEYSNRVDSPRRRKKRLVWASAGTLVLLIVGGWLLAPRIIWDGAVVGSVSVHVTDASSGQSIAGATLIVLDYSGKPSRFLGGVASITDASGNANVRMMLGAGGQRGLVLDRYAFGEREKLIQVTAPGYVATCVAPGDSTTFRILRQGPMPKLRVKVTLARTPTTGPTSR